MKTQDVSRRLPVGANIQPDGVHFRVWAPDQSGLAVSAGGKLFPLAKVAGGYHEALVPDLAAGDLYRIRLNGEDFPDPASRFQPEGPHGPSQIIDPTAFRWTDKNWKGIPIEDAVIYEMHIGTFTAGGTWKSAEEQLPALVELGVNVLEVMPIADFAGRYGWGYDGVDMFAPTRNYGTPDDARHFIDRAHALGMAVILDVVYNHLGADGNYLSRFSKYYFSEKHTTDWGDAINFDGENNAPVREFFIANAAYWITEFHFDGLRLDATQNVYDDGTPHILLEVTESTRKAAGERITLVIAENEPQQTHLVRDPKKGGFGMDGLWNDDFHHSAVVAMTAHNDAYYTDYFGTPQELISALKYGYLYQGQWYKWQSNRRGTPSRGIAPPAFVTFIENHDQVANSARGLRMHRQTSPGLLKTFTALLLLGPGTPMLFQGQEFNSSKRFQFFADLPPDLAEMVRKGRREFMTQWRTIGMPEMMKCLEDPCIPETFERSKLDHAERETNAEVFQLHVDLLKLRRTDPLLRLWKTGAFDGAVLGPSAFCVRVFGDEDQGDRLLIFNIGMDLHLNPAPEPLLAPLLNMEWEIVMSTEHPLYGGCGTAPMDTKDNWRIPGQAAVLLRSVPRKPATPEEKEKK